MTTPANRPNNRPKPKANNKANNKPNNKPKPKAKAKAKANKPPAKPYTNARLAFWNAKPALKRELTRHYNYLYSDRVLFRDHFVLSQYIQGALMQLARRKLSSQNIATRRRLGAIIQGMSRIIKRAPAIEKPVMVARAHVFRKSELAGLKAGKTVKFELPTSTTMHLPFAVEWVYERPHRLANDLEMCVLVISVRSGFDNGLFLGCPEPEKCTAKHRGFFRKAADDPMRAMVYAELNQHQIENQSEMILGAKTRLRVVRTGTMLAENINNRGMYGRGWYEQIAQGDIDNLLRNGPVRLVFCETA